MVKIYYIPSNQNSRDGSRAGLFFNGVSFWLWRVWFVAELVCEVLFFERLVPGMVGGGCVS